VCFSTLALCSIGASTALAQTAPDTKLAVQVAAGPTLGHKSSGFVSGELDWRLNDKIDVYGEVGHMANVATSNLDANAAFIANAVGAQVGSTGIAVNHLDFGIKFHITPPRPDIHPYVIVGIGAAHATTETTFTVNGQPADPEALGILLGGDLSGSNWKTILVFGGGLVFPFRTRYFIDAGYRFGGILSNVSDIENDITIKTQRIMIGAGMRF
jgi:opacity protein-like surface antigen